MKKYFLEPITHNLIVVDTNTGNAEVIPELKNVRIFRADGEAYMSQGHEDNDMQSSVRPPKAKGTGKRRCSKCGTPGHIARHCKTNY